MSKLLRPFEKLRNAIQVSANSAGYEGYDPQVVDTALQEFEQETIITDLTGPSHKVYRKLVKEAQRIAATNQDMDTRDFARSVAAFLIVNHSPTIPGRPVTLMTAAEREAAHKKAP